jgi:hypothetical protein
MAPKGSVNLKYSKKADPTTVKRAATAKVQKRKSTSKAPRTASFKCRAKVAKKMCGNLFATFNELKNHLQSQHPSTQLLFCEYGCTVVYTSSSSLSQHILSAHTDKIVPCPYCVETTFTEVDEFIDHLKENHPEHKEVIQVPLKFLNPKIPHFNYRALGHKNDTAVTEKDELADAIDENDDTLEDEILQVSLNNTLSIFSSLLCSDGILSRNADPPQSS